MTRRVRLLLGLLGVTVVTAAAVFSPLALRRMQTFRVRRVEVLGTRFLPPHDALRASGINQQSSVFDEFDVWQRALANHSLVRSAKIERKLPSTIRITIVEAEPVALSSVGEGQGDGGDVLRAVNIEGEILPVNPLDADLDLPILTSSSPSTSPSVRAALALLVTIRSSEPAMYGWISDVEPMRDAVRMRLRSPAGAVLLLPANASPAQLRELRTTLADLAARQDITRLVRIDARYRNQIVVALTPTAAAL